MIFFSVKKCHNIPVCVRFSLDLDFFSVHIDKVLVWLRLRKIDVLKESFSKTLLYITDIKIEQL